MTNAHNPAMFNAYPRPTAHNSQLYDPRIQDQRQQLQARAVEQREYLLFQSAKAQALAISPAEAQEKDDFRQELESLVLNTVSELVAKHKTTLDPNRVKLKCYGSLANGFAVRSSDLDLLLMFPRDGTSSEEVEVESKRALEKAILDHGYGGRLLTHTRVPILRVCQKPDTELLQNLRAERTKWENEVKEAEKKSKKPQKRCSLGDDRLPELREQDLSAASKAFAELEIDPATIPLPPSPTRDNAHLEYKGDLGIQCDINFSNYVAVHNTRLLRCYAKCDSRVREMGIFVKAWAKARKINTPYHGTLSSYGYILMVLHYLMNVATPPVIPNLQHWARDADAWAGKTTVDLFEGFDIRFEQKENTLAHDAQTGQLMPMRNMQSIGDLLRGFFRYYGDNACFSWTREVISIRTNGGLLTKQSKGWISAKSTGENNQIRLRYLLTIEDPFEIEHNIARTVGHHGLVAIRDEFRRGYEIISKVQLTRHGWQWRRQDGSMGDDLLQELDDRGDLLKQDQEHRREKFKAMKAAEARMRGDEEKDKTSSKEAKDLTSNKSQKNVESGMSTASNPVPAADSNSPANGLDLKLTRKPRQAQPRPYRPKGRQRLVVHEDDGSEDEQHAVKPCVRELEGQDVSAELGNTSRDQQVCAEEACNGAVVPIGKAAGADGYEPYIDESLLKAEINFRIEHVCEKPKNMNSSELMPWNMANQEGRWLYWRDGKAYKGEWTGENNGKIANPDHPRYWLHQLDKKFPFDPRRPKPSPQKIKRWLKYFRAPAPREFVRGKRLAYFSPSEGQQPENRGEVCSPSRSENIGTTQVGQDRKDSAISGIFIPDAARVYRNTNGSQKPASGGPGPTDEGGDPAIPTSALAAEAADLRSMTDADTAPSPADDDQYDMTVRPRDEDPNIMPIPRKPGFQFDPRQLRDLEIIKQGGNGCAREGEEWNVEIEGEWGGGGMMGAHTSTALVTSGQDPSGEQDAGFQYGQGDAEGLLGELPCLEVGEV